MRLVALCAIAACACHHRAPEAPLAGHWHTLAQGETLLLVAARYRVPVDDLVELNAIEDADRVEEGTELFVPEGAARPPVRSGSGLGMAAIGVAGAIPARLAWPVDASVSSPFGPRDGRPHEGIDLVVPDGTPVRAAADGVVVYAGDRIRGYGRLLVVEHPGGLVTVYAHNSELLVAEGARVSRGQRIARSGHSGHVSAPHLHFEVRRGGEPIDPQPLLGGR